MNFTQAMLFVALFACLGLIAFAIGVPMTEIYSAGSILAGIVMVLWLIFD